MVIFAGSFKRRFFKAIASLCLGLTASFTTLAHETGPGYTGIDQELAELTPEEREELFVFVSGNVIFTLYREAGHMLLSELELPVLAQEEDAADNLATISMLAADTEDMDLLLTNAMIGWFLIADEEYDDLPLYDEHDLDRQRGFRMLCFMVGADEETFLELAIDLGLPDDRIETCGFDYAQAAGSWETVTDPFVRESDRPAGRTRVIHEPAPAGLSATALFLGKSGLVEQVAEEIDTAYQLPEEITFRAAACGEENAFWDHAQRHLIICHELVGAFAKIYLNLLDGQR